MNPQTSSLTSTFPWWLMGAFGTCHPAGAALCFPKADLSSEVRLYQAFSRRRIALEAANVATVWPPQGFMPASMDQLLRADKELWQRVASSLPSLPTLNAATAVGMLPLRPARRPLRSPSTFFRCLGRRTPFEQVTGQAHRRQGRPPRHRQGPRCDKSATGSKGDVEAAALPVNRLPSVPICFDRSLAHGCKEELWQVPQGMRCKKGSRICMKCGSAEHGAASCQAS